VPDLIPQSLGNQAVCSSLFQRVEQGAGQSYAKLRVKLRFTGKPVLRGKRVLAPQGLLQALRCPLHPLLPIPLAVTGHNIGA
jgi:hypothetical protein